MNEDISLCIDIISQIIFDTFLYSWFITPLLLFYYNFDQVLILVSLLIKFEDLRDVSQKNQVVGKLSPKNSLAYLSIEHLERILNGIEEFISRVGFAIEE